MRAALAIAVSAVVVVAAGAAAFWIATSPDRYNSVTRAPLPDGDAARGEQVFWAGGCASCHASSDVGEGAPLLGGGERLATAFGTFVAPNISSHPADGIGNWSGADFANAMLRGVSPGGAHYYPAFPYASYARMTVDDVADLYAFMRSRPAVEGRAPENEIPFPYNIRRGVGLWKLANLDGRPAVALDGAGEQAARGQYLVEALGHCGECHTPRTALQGLDASRWLAGAPSMEGGRAIPNITPHEDGIGDWSEDDIVAYLETGFTPDFDSAGGKMADVVQNLARLEASDREAIAAYLKAIPPVPDAP